MTDFGKFCVLLVVLALGVIIGGNIPHMPDNPPPKVSPHIFNLAEPIITYDDHYEYIGEVMLLPHTYFDGEQLDDNNELMDFGDVRVSKDLGLEIGDKVMIEIDAGILEGEHEVKAVHGRGLWADVIVAFPITASAITGTCRLWRVR